MDINLWPYIELSRHLIKIKRKGTGNMFRHQLETFAILLEYGYIDSVLLKASLIHDLFEDGHKAGFTNFDSVIIADNDGKEVFELVKELSIRVINNIKEPKGQFLERIMKDGSRKAKILKLADRMSNINSLRIVDSAFTTRYVAETKLHILPYAEEIDKEIACELKRTLSKFDI